MGASPQCNLNQGQTFATVSGATLNQSVPQLSDNGHPRRYRIDLNTPAELAIRQAMRAVESAGVHPLLTEAIVLLDQAKDKVADFVELPAAVDGQASAKLAPSQQPGIGRIVHYVIPTGPRKGQHRPAVITQVWQPIEHESAPGMSNLTVFRGQADDFPDPVHDPDYTPKWVGSVLYSAISAPGSWHWPERD